MRIGMSMWRQLLHSLIGAFLLTGCGKQQPQKAKSDLEFGQILAETFRRGDSSGIASLHHPVTPDTIVRHIDGLVAPFLKIRPDSVNPSIVKMSEVDIDLPGAIEGRNLRYTTKVDGVVKLDGISSGSKGDLAFTLYLPFSKSQGRYFLAGVGFAEDK